MKNQELAQAQLITELHNTKSPEEFKKKFLSQIDILWKRLQEKEVDQQNSSTVKEIFTFLWQALQAEHCRIELVAQHLHAKLIDFFLEKTPEGIAQIIYVHIEFVVELQEKINQWKQTTAGSYNRDSQTLLDNILITISKLIEIPTFKLEFVQSFISETVQTIENSISKEYSQLHLLDNINEILGRGTSVELSPSTSVDSSFEKIEDSELNTSLQLETISTSSKQKAAELLSMKEEQIVTDFLQQTEFTFSLHSQKYRINIGNFILGEHTTESLERLRIPNNLRKIHRIYLQKVDILERGKFVVLSIYQLLKRLNKPLKKLLFVAKQSKGQAIFRYKHQLKDFGALCILLIDERIIDHSGERGFETKTILNAVTDTEQITGIKIFSQNSINPATILLLVKENLQLCIEDLQREEQQHNEKLEKIRNNIQNEIEKLQGIGTQQQINKLNHQKNQLQQAEEDFKNFEEKSISRSILACVLMNLLMQEEKSIACHYFLELFKADSFGCYMKTLHAYSGGYFSENSLDALFYLLNRPEQTIQFKHSEYLNYEEARQILIKDFPELKGLLESNVNKIDINQDSIIEMQEKSIRFLVEPANRQLSKTNEKFIMILLSEFYGFPNEIYVNPLKNLKEIIFTHIKQILNNSHSSEQLQKQKNWFIQSLCLQGKKLGTLSRHLIDKEVNQKYPKTAKLKAMDTISYLTTLFLPSKVELIENTKFLMDILSSCLIKTQKTLGKEILNVDIFHELEKTTSSICS